MIAAEPSKSALKEIAGRLPAQPTSMVGGGGTSSLVSFCIKNKAGNASCRLFYFLNLNGDEDGFGGGSGGGVAGIRLAMSACSSAFLFSAAVWASASP